MVLFLFWLARFPVWDGIGPDCLRSEQKSRSGPLEEVSVNYQLRFAFNADASAKIVVNLRLESVSTADFLDKICLKYHSQGSNLSDLRNGITTQIGQAMLDTGVHDHIRVHFVVLIIF